MGTKPLKAPSSSEAVHAWTATRQLARQALEALESLESRLLLGDFYENHEKLYLLRVHLEHIAAVHGLCSLCFGEAGDCKHAPKEKP